MRGPWRSALFLVAVGMGSVSKWWKTSAAESTPGSSEISFMRVTMSASDSVSRVTTNLPPDAARNLDSRHAGQGGAHLRHVLGPDVQDEARHVRLRRARLDDAAGQDVSPGGNGRRHHTGPGGPVNM